MRNTAKPNNSTIMYRDKNRFTSFKAHLFSSMGGGFTKQQSLQKANLQGSCSSQRDVEHCQSVCRSGLSRQVSKRARWLGARWRREWWRGRRRGRGRTRWLRTRWMRDWWGGKRRGRGRTRWLRACWWRDWRGGKRWGRGRAGWLRRGNSYKAWRLETTKSV